MAVIENASSPEAVMEWTGTLKSMSASEMMAQQICQRGAEHALMELQKAGATPERCQAMLDSVRHGLITIHEAATARGIDLLSYSVDEQAPAAPEAIVPIELSRAVEGPRVQHPDADYPCLYDHTGNILDINKVLVQRLELRGLLTDNELLRQHAAREISDNTMLTGLSMSNGGINMGIEGGAAGLLVESFVHQFKNTGGINYVELMFTSTEVMPGERFTVTLQRVNGLTPAQKLAAAEKELETLRKHQESVADVEGIFESKAIAAYAASGGTKPWTYLEPGEWEKWRAVVNAVHAVNGGQKGSS